MTTLYTLDGCSYTGMDQETVIRLRQELGKLTDFVLKEEFEQSAAILTTTKETVTQELIVEELTLTIDARLDQLIQTLTTKGIL